MFKVVIPSGHAGDLRACLFALYENQPDLDASRVIVITDGIVVEDPRCTVIPGRRPFNWCRAVNTGAKAAGDSDVLIVDDNATLQTRNGIELLAQSTADLIGPKIDGVGPPWQSSAGEVKWLIGCFLHVKRRVLDKIQFDEGYTGAAFQDIDFCYAALAAGFKLGVNLAVTVRHDESKLYDRPDIQDLRMANRARLYRKWKQLPGF